MSRHLLHVQRCDGRDVADSTLPDDRLGKLHLRRDVGHLHRVVVVVGDVQGVLQENKNQWNQWKQVEPLGSPQ